MSYRLPPLNGLRAFEAAARHLSFKHAATELAVTPGAVGQQVRALERTLGVALFRRLPRSVVLTTKGEAYLAAIGPAFRAISAATETIAPALSGRRLRLGIAPRLLMRTAPAIAGLRHDSGSKRVADVVASDDLAALIDGRVDALLRKAGGRYPGFHAERIALRGAGEDARGRRSRHRPRSCRMPRASRADEGVAPLGPLFAQRVQYELGLHLASARRKLCQKIAQLAHYLP